MISSPQVSTVVVNQRTLCHSIRSSLGESSWQSREVFDQHVMFEVFICRSMYSSPTNSRPKLIQHHNCAHLALKESHACHPRLTIRGTHSCIPESGEIVCHNTTNILERALHSASLVGVLLFDNRRRLGDPASQDVTLDKVRERHLQLVTNELLGGDLEHLCETGKNGLAELLVGIIRTINFF
jgi:hypothetical protein